MAWVVFWIFFQVLSRYVFKSIYWSGTEELARYSYIWMIFLGAALLSRDNAHLKVEILKGIIGEEKGVYIDIVWEIVTAAFFLYLTPFAWKICQADRPPGRGDRHFPGQPGRSLCAHGLSEYTDRIPADQGP